MQSLQIKSNPCNYSALFRSELLAQGGRAAGLFSGVRGFSLLPECSTLGTSESVMAL